ncbi:unnamed protein product [Danaus chrysippus]|uniref:(African queen) hypothetical protein n=1 Tax=Danaus chrysippus TaxID=151541 RepID=A0A8J2QNB4_9NEOP|nr:unnamed protein product [Danaus chrysippus]
MSLARDLHIADWISTCSSTHNPILELQHYTAIKFASRAPNMARVAMTGLMLLKRVCLEEDDLLLNY